MKYRIVKAEFVPLPRKQGEPQWYGVNMVRGQQIEAKSDADAIAQAKALGHRHPIVEAA